MRLADLNNDAMSVGDWIQATLSAIGVAAHDAPVLQLEMDDHDRDEVWRIAIAAEEALVVVDLLMQRHSPDQNRIEFIGVERWSDVDKPAVEAVTYTSTLACSRCSAER